MAQMPDTFLVKDTPPLISLPTIIITPHRDGINSTKATDFWHKQILFISFGQQQPTPILISIILLFIN